MTKKKPIPPQTPYVDGGAILLRQAYQEAKAARRGTYKARKEYRDYMEALTPEAPGRYYTVPATEEQRTAARVFLHLQRNIGSYLCHTLDSIRELDVKVMRRMILQAGMTDGSSLSNVFQAAPWYDKNETPAFNRWNWLTTIATKKELHCYDRTGVEE